MRELVDIPLDLVHPSPFQMRSSMDAELLDELVESLKRDGQQRPLKVRHLPEGEYELVFGHRTVAAAERAGIETLQAVVEDLDDEAVMWAQYAENEYREDISDYDRARWLRAMIDRFGYSQTELARKLSRDNSWVSHHLGMLRLDGVMSRDVLAKISERQARAILSASEDHLPTVCREVEEYWKDQGELPSTSVISSIVHSIKFYVEVEDETAPVLEETPAGTHGEPSDMSAGRPVEDLDTLEAEAETASDLRSTAEKYIADFISRYPKPDLDFLVWDVARRYGVTEEEARKLVEKIKAESREPDREFRFGRTALEPETPATCICPLCGRGGADRNLILTRVEDPELAQMTLAEFVTEGLR